MKLLHLNLDVIKTAKKSAAYKIAAGYIQFVLMLLPSCETKHHELYLECLNEVIIVYYSTGEYDKLEETSAKIKKLSINATDYALAGEYLMKSYIARNQAFKAIDSILENFKSVNILIPRTPSEEENRFIMDKTIRLLDEKGLDYLKDLAPMSDEKFIILMKLSCIAGTIIFFAAPELELYTYCALLLLILEKGLTAESPYFLSLYAMKRAADWMDNVNAFQLGEYAESLFDRNISNSSMKVKTDTMICFYSYSLKHHFKTLYKKMIDTYFTAINLGDFEFASYLLVISLFCLHSTDTDLITVSEKMKMAEKSLAEINQTFFSDTIKILTAFTNALRGKTKSVPELEIDKEQLLKSEAIGTRIMNSRHAYDKTVILSVIFEKYDNLAHDLAMAEEYCKKMGAPVTYIIEASRFYRAPITPILGL